MTVVLKSNLRGRCFFFLWKLEMNVLVQKQVDIDTGSAKEAAAHLAAEKGSPWFSALIG